MPTHYKGSPQQQRALNAYINLTRAAESLTNRVHTHLAGSRLSNSEFSVLEVLQHLGPLRQNTIAQKILRTRGNITIVIDNLEDRGLVQRNPESEDRRCTTVELTAAGRQLIKTIFEAHVRVLLDEMSVLSSAEQESLRAICRKLGRGKAATNKLEATKYVTDKKKRPTRAR